MNDLPRPPQAEIPQTSRPTRARRARWVWPVLLLLAGGLGWYGWQQGWLGGAETTAPAPRRGLGAPAIPVTAATATVENLPILLDALGTVQASNTVTIVPQVSGRITEILFREGQEVTAGEVLVRIDSRSYQAALDQAVATRAQRQAQLANAQRDLQRYTQLARSSGTSQQVLDTQRATVAQLEAQLQFDQAVIENAQAQLDDTTIRSPIDGRVGLRQVDVGNFVQSSSTTGIVVVTQLRPVAVNFTLPQQSLPQVMEALQAGDVPVEARLAETAPPRLDGSAPLPNPIGRLVTVDNQVDQATGTIRLKAEFANADLRLWPGAFVNTRLQVALLRDVVVLPLVAVQRGPQGPFAFVVRDDNTVEQRPLTLGTIAGQQAVVLAGMQPGERAVSSGALRLVSGSAVQVADPVVPVAVPRQVRRRPGGGPGGRPAPAAEGAPAPAAEGATREGAAPARRPATP